MHLENYFRDVNLVFSRDRESQLIARLLKTKSGYKASRTKGISCPMIRGFFKQYITETTENPQQYGFYSLTSGDVSAAANNGITDGLISNQGKW